MANAKSKVKMERNASPLPEHFKSLEEAAAFWDAHDSADYEEHMSEVDGEAHIERSVYLISLDGALFRKVHAIAEKKGLRAETLVNRWIEEKAS